jgi:hypothetical protein
MEPARRGRPEQQQAQIRLPQIDVIGKKPVFLGVLICASVANKSPSGLWKAQSLRVIIRQLSQLVEI